MNTRFLMIFAIGISGFFIVFDIQQIDAMCKRNSDWPAAPCYGCPGCVPSLEKQTSDWEPYYDYKGADFMENKKREMLDAIKNNQLDEWRASGPRDQNSNVYQYYELHGITNEMMVYGLSDYVALIFVTVVMTSGIVIFILKRK